MIALILFVATATPAQQQPWLGGLHRSVEACEEALEQAERRAHDIAGLCVPAEDLKDSDLRDIVARRGKRD